MRRASSAARSGACNWFPGSTENIHGTMAEFVVRSVLAPQTRGSRALVVTCSAKCVLALSIPPTIAQTPSSYTIRVTCAAPPVHGLSDQRATSRNGLPR